MKDLFDYCRFGDLRLNSRIVRTGLWESEREKTGNLTPEIYDRYENIPFGNYIIGSPTFWTPYFTGVSDYEEYKNEYGYFDRNDSYDRELFITAGDSEDEDYREYYGDNDSTLEGVEHLKERLDGHGVTYKTKTYKSNHYQYVSGMLVEYAAPSENT